MSNQNNNKIYKQLFKNNDPNKGISNEILKKIKSKETTKNNGVLSHTHFLKFNAMYFSNKNNANYTRKFYEVYTSYIMLLDTFELMKTFLNEYIEVSTKPTNNVKNKSLQANVTISDELNFNTIVYPKEVIETISFYGGPIVINDNIDDFKKLMNNYKKQRGLITLRENDYSNITLFQTLFIKYNRNERLKKIIMPLIDQYNLFKSKIFDILSENDKFDYGLLGYAFLFSFEYFPTLNPNDDTLPFFNKKLYDMAVSDINIDDEVSKLNKANNDIKNKMVSHLSYFYNNSYKDGSLYETLMNALEMDLYGLKFALFYIHPKFLNLFLKRKYKIDKQIYNYLETYGTLRESQNINTKSHNMTSQFIMPSNKPTLFKDFNNFTK